VEKTCTLLKKYTHRCEPTKGRRGNLLLCSTPHHCEASLREAVAISKRAWLRQHILQPFELENEIASSLRSSQWQSSQLSLRASRQGGVAISWLFCHCEASLRESVAISFCNPIGLRTLLAKPISFSDSQKISYYFCNDKKVVSFRSSQWPLLSDNAEDRELEKVSNFLDLYISLTNGNILL
jgi:hypothetical protein